jgi:hypothetical protein
VTDRPDVEGTTGPDHAESPFVRAVQPTLVASGAALAAMGAMGLRAVARSSTESARDRTAA